MKASNVYRRAGDLIREHGWCQGVSRNTAGEFCVTGAARAANQEGANLDGALYTIIATELDWVRAWAWEWNDDPARTVEDVMIALDAAYVLQLQVEGVEPEDVL